MYEGRTRRFSVSSVSTRHEVDQPPDIADDIQSLSLSDALPKLWTVDWETAVFLDTESSEAEEDGRDGVSKVSFNLQTTSYGLIEFPITDNWALRTQESAIAVERGVEKDAYSAVGGLDKQIAQIRDLIEIPLTRPELFRQFGLFFAFFRATPA